MSTADLYLVEKWCDYVLVTLFPTLPYHQLHGSMYVCYPKFLHKLILKQTGHYLKATTKAELI